MSSVANKGTEFARKLTFAADFQPQSIALKSNFFIDNRGFADGKIIVSKVMLEPRIVKSGNPKISRIGRQKRKNIFFLFSPKEPIWLTSFGNDIKRFDFLFFYSKFAKPENSATGLQWRP